MVIVETTSGLLPGTAIEALQAAIRGELITPDSEVYDDARRVYNGMIDKHPALIVYCAGVADVIAAVNVAREHGLLVSIRAGGHNVAGKSVNDGGIVIDLSRMRGIRVDPAGWTARVEGGCTWADVDHAAAAFGLATPGGLFSSTGVAGLTLGGGFGYLTRKHGLSSDNLLSADIVTADGRLVTASADEHPDLFWALRGGGGNFGVVTSFEFRLHPAGTVTAGPIFWEIEHAEKVLTAYREVIAAAPEDLSAFFLFAQGPPAPFVPEHLHFKPICGVVVTHFGDDEQAQRDIHPFRGVADPALDLVGRMPYPAAQAMFDEMGPPGLLHYWKTRMSTTLSDATIATHVEHGRQVPSLLSFMHIYPLDGAQQRVDARGTAWAHRDASFAHIIAAVDTDPTNMPTNIAWVRSYWDALPSQMPDGGYVNFLADDVSRQEISASYGDNWDRLVAIKSTWDPDNLFRMNHNIPPAPSS